MSKITIELIEQALLEGTLAPQTCAEYRAWLSGDYSFHAARIAELEMRKPLIWNEMRHHHKSDSATEREYEATQDGKDYIYLKYRLKRVEKLMQGLNGLLRVYEGESKNQF